MIKSKQNGSALLVSLVMLTSVTFLAVLSLQSSTTQLKVVSNLQIKEDMFHTSKRELTSQYDGYRDDINKIKELSKAMENAVLKNEDNVLTPKPFDIDAAITLESKSAKSSISYTKKTPVNLNYSFAKDSSVGAMTSMPFEILSTISDSTGRFHSSQRLGFKYNVPTTGR